MSFNSLDIYQNSRFAKAYLRTADYLDNIVGQHEDHKDNKHDNVDESTACVYHWARGYGWNL